jgi:spermidine synthase
MRVLFFLSGVSGLIYQVVWMRMLTRTLGCTVYASSTVLGSFMAGLAIGSYAAARRVDRARSPVAVYSVLEVGIAACGVLLPGIFQGLVPVFQWLHATWGGNSPEFLFVRATIIFALLLVPTALMGATLPALAAAVSRTLPDFDRQVSWLYGLNTLGAMAGSLLSGLFLLGALGEQMTIAVAAGLNVFVAALAALYRSSLGATGTLAKSVECDGAGRANTVESRVAPPPVRRWLVLASFAATGVVSLGFEVIWTRQLVLFMGTSIYAFSTMLACFLGGLGLGSLLGGQSRESDSAVLPTLGALQCALGALGIWGQVWLANLTPGNPLATQALVHSFGPVLMIFAFALVSGMMFRRVVAGYSCGSGQGGQSLGLLYAANTLGCIVGALGTGFWLIPSMGTSRAAVTLAVLNLAGAGLLWVVSSRNVQPLLVRVATPVLALLSITLAAPALHAYDIMLLRSASTVWAEDVRVHYHDEGTVAATTVIGSQSNPQDVRLLVNGIGMTHLGTVTKLMAHLPLMLHGNAERMLVVCFGMGTTLRSAANYPDLSITGVELVPAVYDCFGHFHPDGPALWDRPNIRRVVDDGRNYLLMNEGTFDVITIDPPPPVHSAGTVNLYTRDFFELCRARLRPRGVVCLWIPPVPRSEVMVILASFGAAFPHTTLWTAPDERGFFCIGRTASYELDRTTLNALLARPEIRRDLTEYGFRCDTSGDLLSLRLLDEAGFGELIRSHPVMTDNRPFTEFPLWRRVLAAGEWQPYGSDDLLSELR